MATNPREQALLRSPHAACEPAVATAWSSISMSTRSPTSTPPASSTWFQVRPSSDRSIEVLAVNAARVLPHGSLPAWCGREQPLHAVYPSRRHLSPQVKALLEHLREGLSPPPWERGLGARGRAEASPR